MNPRAVNAAAPPAQASVDVGVVRDRFNFDWTMSDPIDGTDTFWWWARSIRIDPAEIIADDGEGNLWSVPFSTDGANEVTFGEPVSVRETFVPVAVSEGAAATAMVTRSRQRVLATQLARPDKPARPGTATAAADDQEVTAMDAAELRSTLGLPEDATDDQVRERLAQLPPVTTGGDPDVEEEDDTGGDAAAAEVPDGMVLIGADRLAELEAAVGQVGDLVAARATEERDRFLGQMATEGRLSRAERPHFERMYASDQEATVGYLRARVPVVPVSERGHAATETTTDQDAFAASRATRFGRGRSRQEA